MVAAARIKQRRKREHFKRYIYVGEEDDGEVILGAEHVQPQNTLPTPVLPSQFEIGKHRIDHWPPCSWCDECVLGVLGKKKRHLHHKDDTEIRSATITLDYMFFKKTGEYSDSEAGVTDGGIQIFVVQDTRSKSLFAHVVPQNGIDPNRCDVDMIVDDVLWPGYSQVVLKTDNEKLIAKLLKESLAACRVARVDQVGEQHPPPYESQSNGAVEAAVKQQEGRLRTMVLCPEVRIGKHIPPRHALMALKWINENKLLTIMLRYISRVLLSYQ